MSHIRLFQDTTLNIDLESIANHLNSLCKHVTFSVGTSKFNITEKYISSPDVYNKLSPGLKKETQNDFLAFFVTRKQYNNNFFFESYGNLVVLSLFAWEHLTKLPEGNGLIYFIADFLALEIDNSYRHHRNDETPKPECIYDFGWNKVNVDIGMRSSLICPSCIERINRLKLTKRKAEIFEDLKRILNDLGNASKWDTDLIEFCNIKKVESPNIQNGVAPIMRSQVFISYSHVDSEWLRRLKVHLKPFERNHQIHVWDDTKIKTGRDWKDEIKKALAHTKVAVLMISPDFLASDFIATDELPPLLEAAEKEGAIIMPIILRPCGFTKIPSLSRFQSVNSPSKTLVELTEGEQDRFLYKLTEDILSDIT